MKIGLIYTSTTPELIHLVEEEIKKAFGKNICLVSWQDPSILAQVRESGYVTAQPAARLIKMLMEAVEQGCDGILNVCSSVGLVADAMQPVAKLTGVPIVRIDEEMCRNAVERAEKIAVMATLPTTLEPTKATLCRLAEEKGRKIELIDILVEGAFGLDPVQFQKKMADYAKLAVGRADIILFAQGSMAYCSQYIESMYHIPVLSSPEYGARALKKALEDRQDC